MLVTNAGIPIFVGGSCSSRGPDAISNKVSGILCIFDFCIVRIITGCWLKMQKILVSTCYIIKVG